MFKRRLIFHFYTPKEWEKYESLKIHLECLKYYSLVFTESLFIIDVENPEDTEVIKSVEHAILDCGFTNVQFKVKQNSPLCESETFNEEVVKKLDVLDGLTFFAHTKGIGNEMFNAIGKEELREWICGLYFLSLEYYEEAVSGLYDYNEISYGPYKTLSDNIPNKYHWNYSGTFFWLNTQKLYNKIELNKIKPMLVSDRFFSERYLGDIVEPVIDVNGSKRTECASHYNSYLINANHFYHDVLQYTKLILYEDDYNRFIEFKNNILSKINIC